MFYSSVHAYIRLTIKNIYSNKNSAFFKLNKILIYKCCWNWNYSKSIYFFFISLTLFLPFNTFGEENLVSISELVSTRVFIISYPLCMCWIDRKDRNCWPLILFYGCSIKLFCCFLFLTRYMPIFMLHVWIERMRAFISFSLIFYEMLLLDEIGEFLVR